jgi:hypothetical protein
MLKVKVTPSAKMVTDQIAKAVSDTVRQVSRDLFTEVKRFTPVKSGRARKGWKFRQKNKLHYRISNKVPYINRLDEGYSKQAPNGIVRPAVQEVARKTKRRRKV